MDRPNFYRNGTQGCASNPLPTICLLFEWNILNSECGIEKMVDGRYVLTSSSLQVSMDEIVNTNKKYRDGRLVSPSNQKKAINPIRHNDLVTSGIAKAPTPTCEGRKEERVVLPRVSSLQVDRQLAVCPPNTRPATPRTRSPREVHDGNLNKVQYTQCINCITAETREA